jgi:hypothetical protein
MPEGIALIVMRPLEAEANELQPGVQNGTPWNRTLVPSTSTSETWWALRVAPSMAARAVVVGTFCGGQEMFVVVRMGASKVDLGWLKVG